MPSVIVICGVSASGKSMVGEALAQYLDVPFLEGDNFHPEYNIQKMASGNPLNNSDRVDWITNIGIALRQHPTQQCVLACSALNPFVRDLLQAQSNRNLVWIHLDISFEEALRRMNARDHFMPPSLLQSQFDAWEPPSNAYSVKADQPIGKVVSDIVDHLRSDGA